MMGGTGSPHMPEQSFDLGHDCILYQCVGSAKLALCGILALGKPIVSRVSRDNRTCSSDNPLLRVRVLMY